MPTRLHPPSPSLSHGHDDGHGDDGGEGSREPMELLRSTPSRQPDGPDRPAALACLSSGEVFSAARPEIGIKALLDAITAPKSGEKRPERDLDPLTSRLNDAMAAGVIDPVFSHRDWAFQHNPGRQSHSFLVEIRQQEERLRAASQIAIRLGRALERRGRSFRTIRTPRAPHWAFQAFQHNPGRLSHSFLAEIRQQEERLRAARQTAIRLGTTLKKKSGRPFRTIRTPRARAPHWAFQAFQHNPGRQSHSFLAEIRQEEERLRAARQTAIRLGTTLEKKSGRPFRTIRPPRAALQTS